MLYLIWANEIQIQLIVGGSIFGISLYFKMASQQALALWKSQISSYERIMQRCCNRILSPLTRFLPPDFDQRVEQYREVLSVREPDTYQPYLQVIVHYIEGRKNLSTIELADSFVQEFGGSLKYWQNIIVDVAEPLSYTNDLSIWHIRKLFQEKLFIDAENLSNYRRLCKVTKVYLGALSGLIKAINKFDIKKDSLCRLDDLFKKVKLAQEKYVGFSQQISGLQTSCTMDQLSNNVSQKSKQNALKGLFNFNEPIRVDRSEKIRNTLFNYNFKMKNRQVPSERVSGPTKNVKQTNKAISGVRLQSFQKVLKNLKIITNNPSFQQLKAQFNSKKKQKNQQDTQLFYNYTTIWDKDYFFSYVSHPIDMEKFREFTTPFQRHEWVNYQINSDDEYQDLIGEDVDENTEMSEVSELSKNSFIVSDNYLSDDQNLQAIQKEVEHKNPNMFGDRWSFQRKTDFIEVLKCQKNVFQMVLIQSKAKCPLPTVQRNQFEETLFRVIDGKDKQSIMEGLSKQKIKISKAKLKEFLQKKCKTVVISQNPTKTIYKVLQNQNESVEDEKENLSRKSCQYVPTIEQLNQKDEPEDTNAYEPQYKYYSEIVETNNERIETRLSKKRQHSLKLQNNSNRNSRRQSSNRISTRSRQYVRET